MANNRGPSLMPELNLKTNLPLQHLIGFLAMIMTVTASYAVLQADVADNDERIEALEKQEAILEETAQDIEINQTEIQTKLEYIEDDLTEVKGDLKDIDKKLDRILEGPQ